MSRLPLMAALAGLLAGAGEGHAQRLEPLYAAPTGNVIIGQVTDVDLLPNGGAAVLDQLSHAVLLFDSAGGLVRTLGREGAGPGELRGSAELEVGPAGEVAVLDYRNMRITVWGPDGDLRRTIALSDLTGPDAVWPHELLWEPGGAWLRVSHFTPGAPVIVVRLAPDLTRTLDTALAFTDGAEGAATCLFCPLAATPDGRLAGARGDTAYAVALLDGAGRAVARWTRGDLPAARRSNERTERLNQRAGSRGRAESGRGGERFSPYATRFIARSIGFDARGRLWTLPSAEEGAASIDVFARPGSSATTLRLPVRLFGFRIRGDRLAGIAEGANGEPVVHVFLIEG